MKHLKRYNEVVDNNIIDTLKEICYELTDNGFEVVIDNDKLTIKKRSSNRMISFSYSEIEDVLLRIEDYLGNRYVRTYGISSMKSNIPTVMNKDLIDENKDKPVMDICNVVFNSLLKESKSNLSDIKDIALDIVDDGFGFSVYDYPDTILCSIRPNKNSITETLYETVMRMVDYMQNSSTRYIRLFYDPVNAIDISTKDIKSLIGSKFLLIEISFIK